MQPQIKNTYIYSQTQAKRKEKTDQISEFKKWHLPQATRRRHPGRVARTGALIGQPASSCAVHQPIRRICSYVYMCI